MADTYYIKFDTLNKFSISIVIVFLDKNKNKIYGNFDFGKNYFLSYFSRSSTQ